MGLFEHFPYTNFHGLNLDWILRKVEDSVKTVDELKDFVENLDVQDEVNKKIEEMAESGALKSFSLM